MMQDMTQPILFKWPGDRQAEIVFSEPELSSDGGALLLGQIDRGMGITEALAAAIRDPRHQGYVEHDVVEMIRQRVIQIACGYEDADDCDDLRNDPVFKTVAGRGAMGAELASQPTLTRCENQATAKDLLRMSEALLERSLDVLVAQGRKFVLIDFDPAADHCHGMQQMSLFNGYEDERCYMPFHVYEGVSGLPLAFVLRPGKTPLAGEILAVLKRLVDRIRRRLPNAIIFFRADSHHAKPDVLAWLDDAGVKFIIGLSQNAVLNREGAEAARIAARDYQLAGRDARRFHSFSYAASTWIRPFRVVARAAHNALGADMRYVVTNLFEAGAKYLYDTVYCGRGRAEQMICDLKTHLKSDRTSCHRFLANQCRLLLHAAAYQLLCLLRMSQPDDSKLSRCRFDTLRLRLLKVATRVAMSGPRVRFHLPKLFPLQDIFRNVFSGMWLHILMPVSATASG
jgi:hypothetical protein